MSQRPRWCAFLVLIFGGLFMGSLLPDCTDPEVVCLNTVDIAAKTTVRCGEELTYEQARQIYIDQWALGDCKNIKKVRDTNALVKQCLPWLEKVSCHIIQSGRRLPACENQLLLDTQGG